MPASYPLHFPLPILSALGNSDQIWSKLYRAGKELFKLPFAGGEKRKICEKLTLNTQNTEATKGNSCFQFAFWKGQQEEGKSLDLLLFKEVFGLRIFLILWRAISPPIRTMTSLR